MDIRELQIDDWVHYIGDERTNEVSFRVRENRGDIIYADFCSDEFTPEELEPIPITSKILEKNGFFYNENSFTQYWTGKGLIIDQSGKLFYIRTLSTSIIIHYVHELQHLMKLCGIKDKVILSN